MEIQNNFDNNLDITLSILFLYLKGIFPLFCKYADIQLKLSHLPRICLYLKRK